MTASTGTMALAGDVYMIDVSLLEVEPDCQRETDLARAGRMAAAWNMDKAGVLHVAEVTEADGSIHYYVMDGGHRFAAGRSAKAPELRCQIHYGLDKKQRAEMFLELNEKTVKPGKMIHHRVGVTADRADAMAIEDVMLTYGLKIGNSPSKNTVAAIAGCYTVVNRYGAAILGDTIKILQDAWAGRYGGETWKGEFIVGVARFLASNPTASKSRVTKVLSKMTPSYATAYILEKSKGSGGSGGRPIHMASLIHKRYDTGLRTGRLPKSATSV
jgi:Family of unknown function (DUF6551)